MAKKSAPIGFSDDVALRVCGLISEGLSLRKIEKCEGMPTKTAIMMWLLEGEAYKAQKAFEAKAEELQAYRNSGGRVIHCPSCRFESVRVEEPVGAIAEAKCTVCRFFKGAEVIVACCDVACAEPIRFTSWDGPPSECPTCKEALSKEDVREALDTGEAITKHNYFDHVPIKCPPLRRLPHRRPAP